MRFKKDQNCTFKVGLTKNRRHIFGQLHPVGQHVLGVVKDGQPELEAVLQQVNARRVLQIGRQLDHVEQERGEVLRNCTQTLKNSFNW